jgi:RNA polymerase sigma-70 factor, ECF subfamily
VESDHRELVQAGYRYALSLTHREADAEDLVQEAWLRLYQRRKGEMNKPLLFTAIRNLFVDQHRRHRLVVFERLDEEREWPDPSSLQGEVSMEDLEPALAALRPEEREAIFLNSVEGYTAQEIADLTRRPRNTVLSMISRGKKKMARTLRQLWDSGRESVG